MGIKLHGIIPAMVTPFTSDEQLNEQALCVLVNHLIDDGVHGVFVPGSQGEYYALDHAEKRQTIEVTVEAVAGRVAMYTGTVSTTTRDTVTLTQMAERAGVDAVSVITPTFITSGQDELHPLSRHRWRNTAPCHALHQSRVDWSDHLG